MFGNEADVYLHMERVHEYGEECALYPCEECGYRGQDKLNLDTHIKECHNLITQSINQSDSTFEEFGIEKLPEYSNEYDRTLMISLLMIKETLRSKIQILSIQMKLKSY